MPPWDDWHHCNGNTYGTWLRGDPRGWRARHHREHVVGDYKNPPPKGMYDELHKHSKSLMQRPPVRLSMETRVIVRDVMAASLLRDGIDLAALCVDDHHFHILARFPDRDPRRWIGMAKRRSARELSKRGLAPVGGVWAKRFRALPINDRDHARNAYRYILGHARTGAVVWGRRRDGRDNRS